MFVPLSAFGGSPVEGNSQMTNLFQRQALPVERRARRRIQRSTGEESEQTIRRL